MGQLLLKISLFKTQIIIAQPSTGINKNKPARANHSGLITRRWYWMVTFYFAALASFFAMVASVIHFQIIGAIDFFVLMIICGAILGVI